MGSFTEMVSSSSCGVDPLYLIVGIDGTLGARLYAESAKYRQAVIGTTRRTLLGREDQLVRFLDLQEQLPRWILKQGASCAFLCAGITTFSRNEEDYSKARLTNVTRTIELADALMSHGTFVVFPSTTAVFPAGSADVDESAATAPETTYGKLKAEAEQELLRIARRCPAPGGAAIVRITKVVSASKEPFRSWLSALSAKCVIEPYSDLEFAPVSVTYAVDSLLAVAQLRRTGIYHLSGAATLTYAQFALLIAERLGADPSLITPVPTPKQRADRRPAMPVKAALNMRETSRLLDVFPQQPREVAEHLVREYRSTR